jgi:hypothetical protein
MERNAGHSFKDRHEKRALQMIISAPREAIRAPEQSNRHKQHWLTAQVAKTQAVILTFVERERLIRAPRPPPPPQR